jgi:hypothetical protein
MDFKHFWAEHVVLNPKPGWFGANDPYAIM